MKKSLFCRKLFLLLNVLSSTLAYSEVAPLPAQMMLNHYQAPLPLKADNKFYLVYEIYLTNYMKSPAKIESFEIDGDNENLLKLADLMHSFQSRSADSKKDALTFSPGETKTLYVWIPFNESKQIPKTLTHHLTINSEFKNVKSIFPMGSYQITTSHQLPVIVDSPLRGKNWLAGNAPSNTSDHRRTGLILNGTPYYAQRYAIDFVQVGKDGKSYKGDPKQNSSYHCYNQDLLAVADGTIVQLQDGIPQNIPNTKELAVPLTEKNVPGNYLIIDLGNGNFAGYAHIIPGSFKVKLGDRVTRGQVLAKLGNSGNSSEPHLHFQIMNNKIFLESNGIPYGFKHFYAHPSELINDVSGGMAIKPTQQAFKEYKDQLVLENALMDFTK